MYSHKKRAALHKCEGVKIGCRGIACVFVWLAVSKLLIIRTFPSIVGGFMNRLLKLLTVATILGMASPGYALSPSVSFLVDVGGTATVLIREGGRLGLVSSGGDVDYGASGVQPVSAGGMAVTYDPSGDKVTGIGKITACGK